MVRSTLMRPSLSDIQPERMRPEALPKAPTTSVMVVSAPGGDADALGERHQLADHHESGGATQRVRHPHQIEGGRAQHFAGTEFVSCGGRIWTRRAGRPTGGPVTGRRILRSRNAPHRHHQEDGAQDLERGGQTVGRDQLQLRQRSEDRRSRAVPAHCQTHRQAAFIGEPLGHYGMGVA